LSILDRHKVKNAKVGTKITTKTLKEKGHFSNRDTSGAWEIIEITPSTVQLYKYTGSSKKPWKVIDIEIVVLKHIKQDAKARIFWLV